MGKGENIPSLPLPPCRPLDQTEEEVSKNASLSLVIGGRGIQESESANFRACKDRVSAERAHADQVERVRESLEAASDEKMARKAEELNEDQERSQEFQDIPDGQNREGEAGSRRGQQGALGVHQVKDNGRSQGF